MRLFYSIITVFLLIIMCGVAGVNSLQAHVELDYPKGGEVFTYNDTVTIAWTELVQHNTSEWVLEYSTDQGKTWIHIADVAYENTTYQWAVPDMPTDKAQIRVTQVNADYQNFKDASGNFTILESLDQINFAIKEPGGMVVMQDTIREADSMKVENLSFPLDIFNGLKVGFPDSTVSEEIGLTLTLPPFAQVRERLNEVIFGDSVAIAAQFAVSIGDSAASHFEFQEPVTVVLPIPEQIPSAVGDKVRNLTLAYRDSTGFKTEGIRTVLRDSLAGIVRAEVSHFSNVAMTSTFLAGTDSAKTGQQVAFKVENPDGTLARADTVAEGSSFQLSGLTFPLQYLNGTEIILPDSALAEDVTVVVDIPGFASIDYQQQSLHFGDRVASAVTFQVMKGDSTIKPFEFDTPVTLKMAIPPNLPDAISNSVNNFILAYRDSVNTFDTTGVQTLRVDSTGGMVTARVLHFSTITMTPEANTATEIKQTENNQPIAYNLEQNYPNPFNPATTIRYSLKKTQYVTLKVYNMLGHEVATLVNDIQKGGWHSVTFNAADLASGLYLYRIETANYSESRKMLLVK